MKVYFIGAGPGAPDLITVRGANLLKYCPLVMYAGSLVPTQLLSYCSESAEIVDTSSLDLSQQVAYYQSAREKNYDVARLHSGDPSIYGATAEQMRSLDQLEIDYEVIPGVSSFTAAAANLAVELTKPDVSQTIILTRTGGRASAVPEEESLDKLAAHGATMCIFLSGAKLPDVIAKLIEHYHPDTPVALVHRATWTDEQQYVGTLGTILDETNTSQWALTTMLLVGEVLDPESGQNSKLYSRDYAHRFRKAYSQGMTYEGIGAREKSTVGQDPRSSLLTPPRMAIWLVREQSLPVGAYLKESLGGTLFESWELQETSRRSAFQDVFNDFDLWILIMANGIAVRYIDGLIKDKMSDPGVVVLDEGCNYAIPLIGGHERGANRLAVEVANTVGAQPIITTATEALKPLTVGIGCRKGASAESIRSAVLHALEERRLEEIREVATVSLKRDETGLLKFCADQQLPLRWFDPESIAARGWTTTPSAWVKQQIGLDGVCEPCALMAAPASRLLVKKTSLNGVAVAIAEDLRGQRAISEAKDCEEQSGAERRYARSAE